MARMAQRHGGTHNNSKRNPALLARATNNML
jgi:hypothetical protein